MPSPSQPRSSTVRRLVFDDHQESIPAGHADNVANIALERKREELDQAKERWNFDFENETPLQGRWQWTQTSSKSETSKSAKESSEAEKSVVVPKESESLDSPEVSKSTKEPDEESKGSETSKKSEEASLSKISTLSESSEEGPIDQPSMLVQRDQSNPGYIRIPGESSASVVVEPRVSDESSSPLRQWEGESTSSSSRAPEHQMVLEIPPETIENIKTICTVGGVGLLSKEENKRITTEFVQSILARFFERERDLEEGSIKVVSVRPEQYLLSSLSSGSKPEESSSDKKTKKEKPDKDSDNYLFPPDFFEYLLSRSTYSTAKPEDSSSDKTTKTETPMRDTALLPQPKGCFPPSVVDRPTPAPGTGDSGSSHSRVTLEHLRSIFGEEFRSSYRFRKQPLPTSVPSPSGKLSEETTSIEEISQSSSSKESSSSSAESKESKKPNVPGPCEMADSPTAEAPNPED